MHQFYLRIAIQYHLKIENYSFNKPTGIFKGKIVGEALLKVEPKSLDQLLHPNFDAEELKKAKPIATGLAASPGAGCGKIYFTAEDATIDNSGDPTITGLKANFTEPGQKVEYVFYSHNAGEYDAFLNSGTNSTTPSGIIATPKFIPLFARSFTESAI